jgi:hypothetical protein
MDWTLHKQTRFKQKSSFGALNNVHVIMAVPLTDQLNMLIYGTTGRISRMKVWSDLHDHHRDRVET